MRPDENKLENLWKTLSTMYEKMKHQNNEIRNMFTYQYSIKSQALRLVININIFRQVQAVDINFYIQST